MATKKGNGAANTINGTSSADNIYGYGGDDTLYGRAGNDKIWGGEGKDKLFGEAGNDSLRGENGNDTVSGGDGNDTIYGGAGNDTLKGDAGTDTLWGGAGNDSLDGGTGISHLRGEGGKDTLRYDPTKENISSLGNYLSATTIDGGSDSDTLYINNRATYTSGGASKPAMTEVIIRPFEDNIIYFDGPKQSDPFVEAGTFKNVEKIVVSGAGGLDFFGSTEAGEGVHIVGTSTRDFFSSSYSIDTMEGGAGNDIFYLEEGAGIDRIISTKTDSDEFRFDVLDGSAARITGFNGAGSAGGDKIVFHTILEDVYPDPADFLSVTEKNGKTTFVFDDDPTFGPRVFAEVDQTGLRLGVDYLEIA